MGIYSALAPFYDNWQQNVDYECWADFFVSLFESFFEGKVDSVLDLGCGTASMTLPLARRGFDMIGVDNSEEMLSYAVERARAEGYADKILFLCQDMREFELYGTVEAVVSCLDCVNHLHTTSDLEKCFSLVHNYLVPNGLFIFDVNSKYKFENVYADNSFVFEDDGVMCVWQNRYNEKTHFCDFDITLFEEDEDGAYQRTDEYQKERMYPLSTLRRLLKQTGFSVVGEYGDLDFKRIEENDERIYIVAKAIK